VRTRQDDQIVLTTYGRASGFCVDPIEKKPLNHFLPGTAVLSFGTAGCNLACRFCQNWDISKSREYDTLADQATPETIASRAIDLGCESVAFTYNDPVIFHEFAIDVAAACTAVNVDLKGFTEEFYREVCAGHLDPVLETLEYIHNETETWLEVTTLLIPGLNDSPSEIDQLTSWIVERLGPDVPLHFTAFHPDFKMLDRPPTPPETLTKARSVGVGAGLRYVYTGNVHDPAGQATYCHECGAVVIQRSQYWLGHWVLDEAVHCLECGTLCAVVFDPAGPGTWGARRLPIRLAG
jgi:pyruvate formate lyase activating enzyme